MLTNETIGDWVNRYIACFRKRMASTDLTQHEISNLDDFNTPTQVLVVSITPVDMPAFSALIGLHLTSQPDGTVWVVGPTQPAAVPAEVEAFLAGEAWDEEIVTDRFLIPDGERSLRHIVASEVERALGILDRHILQVAHGAAARAGTGGKMIMPPDGFFWELYGDFTSLDVDQLVDASITRVSRARTRRESQKAEAGRQPTKPERVTGFGAFFYPRLLVGNRPIRSVGDILNRRNSPQWLVPHEPVLRETYRGNPVSVSEDGLIVVQVDDRNAALRCLNQIMATTWVTGRAESTALRSAELAEVSLDPDNPTNRSMSTSLVSLRNLPAFGGSPASWPDALVPVLSIEDMQAVLREAEAIAENPALSLALLFLHEAHSSLDESDFRQAFIDAWLVVEQWVYSRWRASLAAKGRLTGEIKGLEDQPNWTVAVMAETLELTGEINHVRLDDLHKWRRLRNRVTHDGYTPTLEEAKGVLDLALALFQEQASAE